MQICTEDLHFLVNRFAVQEVASYVKQQLESPNDNGLLVCSGSSSSRMSSALVATWCPAFKIISNLADPGNPPDALIIPDLSTAGLVNLKEYIYTGQCFASSEDATIILGGEFGSIYLDFTCKEQSTVEAVRDGTGELHVGQEQAITSTEDEPGKQVKSIQFSCNFGSDKTLV